MVFLVVYFTPIVVQFNWHCLQILRHLGLDRVKKYRRAEQLDMEREAGRVFNRFKEKQILWRGSGIEQLSYNRGE
ncbi:Chaperone surA [Gossypium arboreum]|uniref:Chaperone surA n=2 Tax=Gossypium arboreum TaxID=29729 RepID=A0A0B0MVT6_GOSAR|nr:hypothetical protein PVK06_005812 [Gossypium arboreum]KHG03061.1 Chaperone surA [Gossypium arboreum]